MTLYSLVPQSPSHATPHLTPEIPFRLGMDVEGSRVF